MARNGGRNGQTRHVNGCQVNGTFRLSSCEGILHLLIYCVYHISVKIFFGTVQCLISALSA